MTDSETLAAIVKHGMDVGHWYYPLGSAWKCSAYRNGEPVAGEFRFTLAEAVAVLVEKLDALPPERIKPCRIHPKEPA